jgi:hypothetical protein
VAIAIRACRLPGFLAEEEMRTPVMQPAHSSSFPGRICQVAGVDRCVAGCGGGGDRAGPEVSCDCRRPGSQPGGNPACQQRVRAARAASGAAAAAGTTPGAAQTSCAIGAPRGSASLARRRAASGADPPTLPAPSLAPRPRSQNADQQVRVDALRRARRRRAPQCARGGRGPPQLGARRARARSPDRRVSGACQTRPPAGRRSGSCLRAQPLWGHPPVARDARARRADAAA